MDLELPSVADSPALVVARGLDPEAAFTSSNSGYRNEVDASIEREEDAEKVGAPVIGLGPAAIVGRPAIENEAAASWPCHLALNAEKAVVVDS